jgi:hypothetical protein
MLKAASLNGPNRRHDCQPAEEERGESWMSGARLVT